MIKNKIFITGIGTGVGKTIFSALLLEGLSAEGMVSVYFKPVETGGNHPQDYLFCSKFADISVKPLYHFRTPASPHISAKLEGGRIDLEKIKRKISEIEKELSGNGVIVIEGAGGILVPLKDKPLYTWADLISEIRIPVVVVSASYLGAINHTLCTIEVLEKRMIKIIGIILNFPHKPESVAEKTNEYTLKKILGGLYLGKIPYIKGIKKYLQNIKTIKKHSQMEKILGKQLRRKILKFFWESQGSSPTRG